MSIDAISIDCLSILRFTHDFMTLLTLLSAMMFIKFFFVLSAILKTSKPYV